MAVCAIADVLVRVPVTVLCPVPDTPPVKPVPVAVAQAYVVVAGMVPVGVYENATAVQVDPVCETIVATGLIVTATVNGAPVVQIPDVGVTLNVAVAATDKVLLLYNVPFS